MMMKMMIAVDPSGRSLMIGAMAGDLDADGDDDG